MLFDFQFKTKNSYYLIKSKIFIIDKYRNRNSIDRYILLIVILIVMFYNIQYLFCILNLILYSFLYE